MGVTSQDDLENAQPVRIIGQDPTGQETYPVASTDEGCLKTHVCNQTGGGSCGPPYWNVNLKYYDMNASNGGVARDTVVTNSAWTTVFYKSGTGLVAGWLLTLELMKSDWRVRFTVDSQHIFEDSNGFLTDDISGNKLYAYDKTTGHDRIFSLGLDMDSETIRWRGPLQYPLQFSTDVKIEVTRTVAQSKKFFAGLVCLSKET